MYAKLMLLFEKEGYTSGVQRSNLQRRRTSMDHNEKLHPTNQQRHPSPNFNSILYLHFIPMVLASVLLPPVLLAEQLALQCHW